MGSEPAARPKHRPDDAPTQRGATHAAWLVWHRVRSESRKLGRAGRRRPPGRLRRASPPTLLRRLRDSATARAHRPSAAKLARSALAGRRRWSVMNALVTNRVSTMAGINDRALRTQLITAHLLGLAYTRYVFRSSPSRPCRSSRSSRRRCRSSSTTWRAAHRSIGTGPTRASSPPTTGLPADARCAPTRTADKRLARSGSTTAARRCDHGTAARRHGKQLTHRR
jgi:hypothetical protein